MSLKMGLLILAIFVGQSLLSLSLSRTSKHTVAETTTDYIVVWCLFFVVVCVHCHSHHFLLQGMGIPYTE